MGYRTRYKLSCSNQDVLKKLKKEIIDDYQTELRDLMTFYKGYAETDEPLKWYGHEEDMRKLSQKYPEVVFTLEGEGEENGDMWLKYYVNGRQQVAHAQITFDEFDPEKLDDPGEKAGD